MEANTIDLLIGLIGAGVIFLFSYTYATLTTKK